MPRSFAHPHLRRPPYAASAGVSSQSKPVSVPVSVSASVPGRRLGQRQESATEIRGRRQRQSSAAATSERDRIREGRDRYRYRNRYRYRRTPIQSGHSIPIPIAIPIAIRLLTLPLPLSTAAESAPGPDPAACRGLSPTARPRALKDPPTRFSRRWGTGRRVLQGPQRPAHFGKELPTFRWHVIHRASREEPPLTLFARMILPT